MMALLTACPFDFDNTGIQQSFVAILVGFRASTFRAKVVFRHIFFPSTGRGFYLINPAMWFVYRTGQSTNYYHQTTS